MATVKYVNINTGETTAKTGVQRTARRSAIKEQESASLVTQATGARTVRDNVIPTASRHAIVSLARASIVQRVTMVKNVMRNVCSNPVWSVTVPTASARNVGKVSGERSARGSVQTVARAVIPLQVFVCSRVRTIWELLVSISYGACTYEYPSQVY